MVSDVQINLAFRQAAGKLRETGVDPGALKNSLVESLKQIEQRLEGNSLPEELSFVPNMIVGLLREKMQAGTDDFEEMSPGKAKSIVERIIYFSRAIESMDPETRLELIDDMIRKRSASSGAESVRDLRNLFRTFVEADAPEEQQAMVSEAISAEGTRPSFEDILVQSFGKEQKREESEMFGPGTILALKGLRIPGVDEYEEKMTQLTALSSQWLARGKNVKGGILLDMLLKGVLSGKQALSAEDLIPPDILSSEKELTPDQFEIKKTEAVQDLSNALNELADNGVLLRKEGEEAFYLNKAALNKRGLTLLQQLPDLDPEGRFSVLFEELIRQPLLAEEHSGLDDNLLKQMVFKRIEEMFSSATSGAAISSAHTAITNRRKELSKLEEELENAELSGDEGATLKARRDEVAGNIGDVVAEQVNLMTKLFRSVEELYGLLDRRGGVGITEQEFARDYLGKSLTMRKGEVDTLGAEKIEKDAYSDVKAALERLDNYREIVKSRLKAFFGKAEIKKKDTERLAEQLDVLDAFSVLFDKIHGSCGDKSFSHQTVFTTGHGFYQTLINHLLEPLEEVSLAAGEITHPEKARPDWLSEEGIKTLEERILDIEGKKSDPEIQEGSTLYNDLEAQLKLLNDQLERVRKARNFFEKVQEKLPELRDRFEFAKKMMELYGLAGNIHRNLPAWISDRLLLPGSEESLEPMDDLRGDYRVFFGKQKKKFQKDAEKLAQLEAEFKAHEDDFASLEDMQEQIRGAETEDEKRRLLEEYNSLLSLKKLLAFRHDVNSFLDQLGKWHDSGILSDEEHERRLEASGKILEPGYLEAIHGEFGPQIRALAKHRKIESPKPL